MRCAAIGLVFVLASLGRADEKAEEIKKQQVAAKAAIEKAGIAKTVVLETEQILFTTSGSETQAKLGSAVAQKAVVAARDGLKVAADEKLWPGKLTVFALVEHDQFKKFARLVEQRRPENTATTSKMLKGDAPYIVVSVGSGEKVKDADYANEVGITAAAAVLSRKAGFGMGTAILPEWLTTGFGRTILIRAEGENKIAANRARVKALLTAKGKAPVWAADAWSGKKGKDGDVLAASLVEFLTYGPKADKFVGFARAFKSETDEGTTVEAALTTIEWTPEVLDAAWKMWAIKGK